MVILPRMGYDRTNSTRKSLISAVIVNKAMTEHPQVHYASLPLGESSYHTVWSLSEELLAVSVYPYSHIADGPYRTWIMDNNGQIMMDVVPLEIGYPSIGFDTEAQTEHESSFTNRCPC